MTSNFANSTQSAVLAPNLLDETSIRSGERSPGSREDSLNSIKLLAGLEEFLESTSISYETFTLSYRGSSEVDRHYTKPMLPWIISEIKNQNKFETVKVEIAQGIVSVYNSKGGLLFSHSVKQIHKCVVEQADHTHFLYTVKPTPMEKDELDTDQSLQVLPKPISIDNQCYLFKGDSEDQVRNFFQCLRQQPRDNALQRTNSIFCAQSLPDLSIHNDSQFYEVLFVGRVKVSHSKVPPTFIDEACEAFRNKQKGRKSNDQTSNSSGMTTFPNSGSGYSVPNIILSDYQSSFQRSRSNTKDFAKALVNFNEADEDSDAVQKSGDAITTPESASKAVDGAPQTSGGSIKDGKDKRPPLFSTHSLLSTEGSIDESDAPPPMRQRLRTISGGTSPLKIKKQSMSDHPPMRPRAGSIGSSRIRLNKQMSESEVKTMSGSEFNRTMLFHIGKEEIQLINPELKTVQLHKNFKDIPQRCQGNRYSDHFGFICRELADDAPVYIGYVFRCNNADVTKEIVLSLTKAFEVVQNVYLKEKQENSMCDTCPIRWFSSLCSEVEGLSDVNAHTVILKRVGQLPPADKELLLAKYEGAEAPEVHKKNIILMMLLRAHLEAQQSKHSHGQQKGPESSLDRVKKSLTSSFQHLLKREPGAVEDSGSESSTPTTTPSKTRMESVSESPLVRAHRPRSSTVSAVGGETMRKEFRARQRQQQATSPLATMSCTAKVLQPSTSGGRQQQDQTDAVPVPPTNEKKAMSEEVEAEVLRGVKPLDDDEEEEKENIPTTAGLTPSRPKIDIFLKIGSPTGRVEDNFGVDASVSPSFRHTILQRVITPSKEPAAVSGGRRSGREWPELKIVWRRAVFRQMLLSRMETIARRKRAWEEELEVRRLCLSYAEEDVDEDTVETWQWVLSRPTARVDAEVLKAGIRHGVPKEIRGEVWLLFLTQGVGRAGCPVLPPSYGTPYDDMIRGLTSQQHAILIDLGRTFPQHPYFTRTLGPGQLGLFNLLKAYSRLDGEVGYCQGLSFVAGVLLMHVDEERSYELLKHLMFKCGVRRQFRQDLDGLQVQMYQLSRLVHDRLPLVYRHLEGCDISPQLYAAPWFLTLFASTFPMHFVVRLFDMLFLYSLEAVFRISLILLREHQDNILRCQGFEDTMNYLKTDLPNIPVERVAAIVDMACEEPMSELLTAYEIEYQVLREELSVTPPRQQADINKLLEEKRNLKRQNLDLVEQLQTLQSQKHALESSNQMLLQSQHHLESRVRFLEVERNNFKQVIDLLWQAGLKSDPDLGKTLPSGLLRYLPKQPSPQRERLKSESAAYDHNVAAELLGNSSRGSTPSRTVPNTLKPPSGDPKVDSRRSPTPDIGLFGSKLMPQTKAASKPAATTSDSSSIFPQFGFFSRESDSDLRPMSRARSSTMDHGSVQRFVRGLTRNT